MSKTIIAKKESAKKKSVLTSPDSADTGTQTETTTDEATDGLQDLFLDSIKDIYWAENHLVKTLPKMQSAAASEELAAAIASHLEQTKGHVQRLNQVFDMLNEKKQAKKCDAMEGITKEGEGIVEDTDTGTPARDTGVIMASQKVEHYEIATYSGIIQLAKKLGYTDVASVLEQTLAEEKETSQKLTQLADSLS